MDFVGKTTTEEFLKFLYKNQTSMDIQETFFKLYR